MTKQQEIIKLNKELFEHSLLVQNQNTKIIQLTAENNRLKSMVKRYAKANERLAEQNRVKQ